MYFGCTWLIDVRKSLFVINSRGLSKELINFPAITTKIYGKIPKTKWFAYWSQPASHFVFQNTGLFASL